MAALPRSARVCATGAVLATGALTAAGFATGAFTAAGLAVVAAAVVVVVDFLTRWRFAVAEVVVFLTVDVEVRTPAHAGLGSNNAEVAAQKQISRTAAKNRARITGKPL